MDDHVGYLEEKKPTTKRATQLSVHLFMIQVRVGRSSMSGHEGNPVQLATRQGPRRLQRAQLHAVRERQQAGLRPLGRARQPWLGL